MVCQSWRFSGFPKIDNCFNCKVLVYVICGPLAGDINILRKHETSVRFRCDLPPFIMPICQDESNSFSQMCIPHVGFGEPAITVLDKATVQNANIDGEDYVILAAGLAFPEIYDATVSVGNLSKCLSVVRKPSCREIFCS